MFCEVCYLILVAQYLSRRVTAKNQSHKENNNMPHATATFNGKVIAETDKWEFVEGNIYVDSWPPLFLLGATNR